MKPDEISRVLDDAFPSDPEEEARALASFKTRLARIEAAERRRRWTRIVVVGGGLALAAVVLVSLALALLARTDGPSPPFERPSDLPQRTGQDGDR